MRYTKMTGKDFLGWIVFHFLETYKNVFTITDITYIALTLNNNQFFGMH